jgi:hypothetical protein
MRVEQARAPLGLASAVGAARAVEDGRTLVLASGDGGFLMGLSDLESLIGAASSAVVVIYNDAAYGAEFHQYGSQGLTEKPMLIPEVDFSGIVRALRAESAIIRSLEDLSAAHGLDRRRRQGNLRGRLPDHLERPGPVAERVDGGLAGREKGGGGGLAADKHLGRYSRLQSRVVNQRLGPDAKQRTALRPDCEHSRRHGMPHEPVPGRHHHRQPHPPSGKAQPEAAHGPHAEAAARGET